MNNTTPAIVMGYTETALSVARALGRRGIPVTGVSPLRTPTTSSRFFEFVREPPAESEDERIDFFVNLGKKLQSRAVILPTFDPNVLFLAKNRQVLEKYFYFILPSHELLKSITSKLDLIDVAKRHKIALPPSVAVTSQSDIRNIPTDFFPCVLKPETQDVFLTEKAAKIGIRGQKAIPVMNESELSSLYERVCEIEPRVTIQKMIVGPDENHLDYHALVDVNGLFQGEFVGKKYRLTPPHFGMGCYIKSVKSDLVVSEGRRILRSLNYSGMANINFKIDERDGQLYFIELNPRFSLWTGLDVACGVDFPYYYYKSSLGEPFTVTKEYALGKSWLSLHEDLHGLRVKIKDGTLTWKKWILSVIKNDVGALFAIDDPLPAVHHLCNFIIRQVGKVVKKIKV